MNSFDENTSREKIASTSPTRLYAFLLRLRPVQTGTLMAFSGEFVHGAFLRWLQNTAPDISAWLHEGNKRRMFTCSSLQYDLPRQRMLYAERENVHLPLDPEKSYYIRITLLLGELFPLLHAALMRYYPHSDQETPYFLQLGKQRFTLEEIILTPEHSSGQCGFTSLTTLIEQARQANDITRKPLRLEFATLTTFNRSKTHGYASHNALLPLPHYVFVNLARRWQDLAPPELAALIQLQRIEEFALEDGIIITDYDLQPHHVHFTTHEQIGFVGSCTYQIRDPQQSTNPTISEQDEELSLPQQLWLLTRMAFYSGLGYKTAMGMGRVTSK